MVRHSFLFSRKKHFALTPNIYECGFQQRIVLKCSFGYVHAGYSNITLNFGVAAPEM